MSSASGEVHAPRILLMEGNTADRREIAARYVDAAVPPMRLMCLLSANTRVQAIFVACLAGDPRLFWWFEIVALTAILIAGFTWHRMVEARLVRAPLSDHFLNEDFTRP